MKSIVATKLTDLIVGFCHKNIMPWLRNILYTFIIYNYLANDIKNFNMILFFFNGQFIELLNLKEFISN